MMFVLGCLIGMAFGLLIGFVWAIRSMEEIMRQMWRGLRMVDDDIADLQNHDRMVQKELRQWFN